VIVCSWLPQIFTQSFVQSQSSKERVWLQQNAVSAELEIDEATMAELAGDVPQVEVGF